MVVVKKNKIREDFSSEKIINTIERNSTGLNIDKDKVFHEFIKNTYSEISTEELEKALILASSSLVEVHTDYDKLAARLFLQKIYKEVFGESLEQGDAKAVAQMRYFVHHIRTYERLDPRLKQMDLEHLADFLDIDKDDKWSFMGITNLYDKLLAKDSNGYVKETPQMFLMRVAMGLNLNEDAPEERTLDLYEIYSNHWGIASTPTLYYSGMERAQLSSCGGGVIADTTESIFSGVTDSFQLGKWSYGIGTSVSKLRAVGSKIKSTGIQSSGIIPFLKILDSTCASVNRGGRKRGAMQFTIENWHYETEEFLKLRRNTGDDRLRTHDLNTALFISDEFMKRVEQDGDWMLIDPKEAKDNGFDLTELIGNEFSFAYQELERRAKSGQIHLVKFIKAKELWKDMLRSLFETGHPWITFKDAMNARNPNRHAGRIYSTNLCTEIAQNTLANEDGSGEYFNCFLSSVNLAEFIDKNKNINWGNLSKTIKILIRALDNANDLNFYPIEGVKKGALKYRSVGIGMMGLQDALFKLKLPFDSKEAIEFVDQLTEFWSYEAINASADLAQEKGSYPLFEGSYWSQGILPINTLDNLSWERSQDVQVNRDTLLDWSKLREKVKLGMRNGYVMSPAPNASTSIYLGVYPCIEPQYANIYAKENMLGKFTVVNDYLANDLRDLGLWTPEIIAKIKRENGSLKNIEEIPDDLKILYRGAFELNPMAQVDHAAVMAKWIDQSHSRNIFVETVSGKLLNDIYTTVWKKGVKSTYYLRTRAATEIEKSTV